MVKFIFKSIPFDNIAFEDVYVLRVGDTKTPACWSLLYGEVLSVRGKGV